MGERKCLNKENLITALTLITHHFSETKQIKIWMENIYFILLSFTIFSVLGENYLSWLAGLFYPVDLWSW